MASVAFLLSSITASSNLPVTDSAKALEISMDTEMVKFYFCFSNGRKDIYKGRQQKADAGSFFSVYMTKRIS